MAETITERYLDVESKIANACRLAGRKREDVKLITVTKGHSAKDILEVLKAGATILGENYPEETLLKIEELNGQIHPVWHMIGHLQSRKIKLMYPSFSCIHSLDSLELAQKINRYFNEQKTIIDVCLEVNIAGEESKFGFDASNEGKREELLKTIESIALLKSLHLIGLMTMPPYAEESTQNEACYNLCRIFCESIKNKFGLTDFKQLSMGTSSDFETAIKCGATFVRVGEAIMGKRIYPEK